MGEGAEREWKGNMCCALKEADRFLLSDLIRYGIAP
jgi:hypothetical protein